MTRTAYDSTNANDIPGAPDGIVFAYNDGLYSEKDVARFRSKIALNPETGCWEWTDALTTSGQAQISMHGKTRPAYRVSYEMLVGPIPPGLVLDHLCRNPSCVNPRHVEPVTIRENTLRGIGPSAVNAQKKRCWRGHEFTPSNTYLRRRRGGVQRECRACWGFRGKS